MIAVVRCYKHITPVIVTVFEKNDEQTQKDALETSFVNVYIHAIYKVLALLSPYLLSYNAPS